jgi:hypothetical protein
MSASNPLPERREGNAPGPKGATGRSRSTAGASRQKTPGRSLAVADRPETAVRISERLALSVPEAAASLGVSERLIRSVLPEIPHCRLGNRVVIPVPLLVEWLRKEAQKEQTVIGKAVDDILGEIQSS